MDISLVANINQIALRQRDDVIQLCFFHYAKQIKIPTSCFLR